MIDVSNPNIAQQWYVPIEIQMLQRWLLCAVLMNLIVLGGELLRSDTTGIYLTGLGVGSLMITRLLLPDGTASWQRWAALGFAAIGLVLGLVSLWNSDLSVYDYWSRGWLILPAALTVSWLTSASIADWCSGISADRAEAGLARNKRLEVTLEAVGSHTLLIHAVALVIIPLVWIFDVAVSPGNVLGGEIGDAFTLEHFEVILGSPTFWVWTKNSLIVSLGTTLLGLSLAVPAGYAFSRFDFSGKKQSMFAFMLIQMFPGIIILVPYFMVMKTLGLLNTSIGLIIAYSVTTLPLCVWMLKGFFDTVPRELEEAAMLDGCTQLQIFFKIVLPLSLPAVAITALFSFLSAWNEFLLALVFNTSNDQFTLPVGLASMIPSTGQRWGDFAAASILVSTPVVILFMLFQKSLVQGLSAGAVKG
jgi:arabinogalactan oligomer/maltooligosaccharide transport system permease protein